MNTSISANTTAVTGGTAVSHQTQHLSDGQRWISFGEFLLGSAIVIGHNVYRVVPNEVPILFVFALISFRLRDGWSALGLRWPVSWRRTILIALGAAVLRILVGTLVIEPVTAHFWPPAIAPSGMKDIAGHGIPIGGLQPTMGCKVGASRLRRRCLRPRGMPGCTHP